MRRAGQAVVNEVTPTPAAIPMMPETIVVHRHLLIVVTPLSHFIGEFLVVEEDVLLDPVDVCLLAHKRKSLSPGRGVFARLLMI